MSREQDEDEKLNLGQSRFIGIFVDEVNEAFESRTLEVPIFTIRMHRVYVLINDL